MDDNDFQHLPEDLQEIARDLIAERDVPDGHLLERVLTRVKSTPQRKRPLSGFVRTRLAALSMLVLCLGLNVSGALASVLQGLGVSSSSANSLNLSNLFNSLTAFVSSAHYSQSAAMTVYCQPHGNKGGSDDNNQGGSEKNGGSEQNKNGGSEQNYSPQTNVVKSTPITTMVKGQKVTTWTQTTTTTTHNSSDQNGGSEGNGGQCQPPPCPPSGSSGSEKNGGSENVSTKVDSYSNNKLMSSTTTNTTKDGDQGGSEQNSGCPSPPPEKPGCGNEQNIGISGNSGAHGGQPPKSEERGDCPHDPGVDGH